jgi:hypothetical protein
MAPSTDTLNLTALHDHYVAAVNLAVADDDLERIDRLAAEYVEEAAAMIGEHEGTTGNAA